MRTADFDFELPPELIAQTPASTRDASRLLVLSYERGRTRLDARASIAADQDPQPGQIALLHETIIVRLGERHLDDLLTIADPLVVTDLPTLLWSPHGHPEAVDALLSLAQATLVDSIEQPVWREALDRASELAEHLYVVDLAWLRSTPWRERVAAAFDGPKMRPELERLNSVTVRHHPASTVAGMLFLGWLASRLGWALEHAEIVSDKLGAGVLSGTAKAGERKVALKLKAAPELSVPGLAGLDLCSASGLRLRLDRGPGGLRARLVGPGEEDREWTIPGASRGEMGVLGEGIRQALLRDPTYLPALQAARSMLV